jgi:HK97 family phage major capsid protein
MTQLPKPGDVFHRRVTVERDALATRAAGDERIPISISSGVTLERHFGREILVHTPEAINFEYAKNGLPFHADHDSTRQIGLVEDVALAPDGKLRGMLRKGNHPDSDWYFKDIEAGIRSNISVGYRLDELDTEAEPGTYRWTRWAPYEVSTVSIPADLSVGVGRSEPAPMRFTFEMTPGASVKEVTVNAPASAVKREEGTNVGPCANDGCNHDFASHQDEGMACQADGCVCPGYVQSPNTPEAPRAAVPTPLAPQGEKENRTMSENTPGSDAPAHKPGLIAVSLEDKRKEQADIYRLANAHGLAEQAPSWVERGLSMSEVKAEIFDMNRSRMQPVDVPGYLGLSAKEGLKYDYTRAIRNQINKQWENEGGFEKEVSDAVAKRLGKQPRGMFIPLDLPVMTRAAVTGNMATTSSLGGAGVQTSVLSLIDLLRNKMLVRQLGATVLSGLTGNITFPRHIVANTMAWEGENPATAHANSAATFDNVALSPKTAMASSAYSRQLLIQESFDVSSFIQNDLATVLAVGMDLAAIDGTGANSQPTGIMRQTGVTTIVHTGTAAGGIPTWAELVSYETQVATNNADIGTFHWITTPGMRGKLKTVLKSTTAGSTYLWESDNTINGYAAHATNQVPSGLTFGTSTTVAHGIVFGNWAELLIGEWGGALEVVIDPYTSAKQGMVEITQMLLVDIAVKHPKAFAVTKGALIA